MFECDQLLPAVDLGSFALARENLIYYIYSESVNLRRLAIVPTICMFRGIKIFINYNEHSPPHFHAQYGEHKCAIAIAEIELINGSLPNKQLKMVYGWAALHQEELFEEWALAEQKQELFPIEPLK